jgi:hypothetical protein
MLTLSTKKMLALLALPAILFSFSVAPINFSGSWSLNEGKSELGQFGGRGAASKMLVDQKADAVSITKTITSFNGDPATSTEVLTEGKESETIVFGAAKKKSTLKWAADGQGFSISYSIAFDRNGQSFELRGVETWSLGADGKTLIMQTALTTPQGDVSTKAVYDKQ